MRVVPVRVSSVVAAAGLTAALLTAIGVQAQTPAKPPAKSIYTCVDATGKRRTSDRPIPECVDREQRELNSDGSLRRTVPPTLTTDERAAAEAQQQQQALSAANQREAVRRDRNLLMRFPNEAAHQKARESALEDVRKSLKLSESRLELLQKERKPLLDEAEFYIGKQQPAKLRQQLDANDAASDAQRSLVLNQQAELVRINDLYDVELARLRKLWSGATPGSLGVLPNPSAAASEPGRKPAL
jgi:hypothetical protein